MRSGDWGVEGVPGDPMSYVPPAPTLKSVVVEISS